ncbi:TetR family transcriptional regulator [Rathayibacter sp. VKM Ac-2803]|uniref:TetR/AcrR family transcriptional regulator n=1 Tax=Rathayibacter sp. VKM Ac-2803 TaxID=2609256 RepID=UPI00135A95BC|nr:TetR family transcriptional regulator [Rathayibacter sp. VKM Ac-2803]MWV47968.1 TetR family transcriptional regulator [Rathayibacter sp. VKM Ac-2803]
MDGLRRDAARNRDRILAAAREAAGRGEALTMNAVARAADVGVGTVYRHFAGVEELEEAVVWNRFDELDQVLSGEGPDRFERTLSAHVALLVEDPLFEAVTARPHPVLPETASKRDALIARLASVLDEARAEGSVRAGVDAAAVLLLACGIAHSIRSAGLTADSDRAQVLLEVVLRGFRPDVAAPAAR